jgi:glycosyltransferase involved in cell wall biosynthesis
MVRLAQELGLSERVEFPGMLDDAAIAKLLSTADLCLAPDPRNPLNEVSTMNKILEYMAFARPIVSYDLREGRVSAGDAAVYVRPNSIGEFAHSVDVLLEDGERRARMGAEGRARIEGPLSWERSSKALIAAYERALRRPLGRRARGRV